MAGSLQAPPEDLNPQDLIRISTEPHYAARRTSSAKLSFAFSLKTRSGGSGREKANTFRRLSMLIGPALFRRYPEGRLVEPPGIAPGSSPLITCAFISIVGASPDPANIGRRRWEKKNGLVETVRDAWTAGGFRERTPGLRGRVRRPAAVAGKFTSSHLDLE